MNPPLTPEKILQTGLAFWPAKTLLSAIELGLFTELARGPEPFDALVGRLGLHQRSARDFLDTLVALGFLQRTGDRYANTPETDSVPRPGEAVVCRRHPRDGEPSPLSVLGPPHRGAAHRTAAERSEERWPGAVRNALRRPGAAEAVPGGDDRHQPWRQPDDRPRRFWKDYTTFVDVGTAQGDLAAQIALANPHLRGMGFDLPEVAPIFEAYVAAVGVATG